MFTQFIRGCYWPCFAILFGLFLLTLGHARLECSWNCSKPTRNNGIHSNFTSWLIPRCTNYSRMRVQWLTCTCFNNDPEGHAIRDQRICALHKVELSYGTPRPKCLVLEKSRGWGTSVVGEGAVTTGVVVNCVTSPSEPTFPVARLLRASAVVAEVDTVLSHLLCFLHQQSSLVTS